MGGDMEVLDAERKIWKVNVERSFFFFK